MALADGGAVDVTGEMVPETIPYHHVAHYVIQVSVPAGRTVEIGPWPDSFPGLDIRREAPQTVEQSQGRQRLTQKFTLMPYRAGSYGLPEIQVLVDGVAATSLAPATLVVRELTPEEEAAAQQWQPLLTLTEAEAGQGGIGAIALGCGIFALIVVALGLWNWRKSRVLDEDSTASAEDKIQNLITRLEQRRITGEEYYRLLSIILRDYVGERFGVSIYERTTPEIETLFREGDLLPDEKIAELLALLRAVEGVKYAQRRPTISQMTEEAECVRNFVVATAFVAEPEPERQSA
tara:strand:- start:193 stop:1068 length:876 start_codon:yes stop_codon:yes gene_type:complete